MTFLIWIQDSAFSTWTRESDWAVFAFLIVHTLGMGMLVGIGAILNLRVLGAAGQLPLAFIERLPRLMYVGLFAAIASGVLLVISYPAKALTNPLFYIKLTLIVIGVISTRALIEGLLGDRTIEPRITTAAKVLAFVCLLLWIGGLGAGKFLAYTNRMLLVY